MWSCLFYSELLVPILPIFGAKNIIDFVHKKSAELHTYLSFSFTAYYLRTIKVPGTRVQKVIVCLLKRKS
jgi:hypothetical protein